MQGNKDILNELGAISPVVAGINPEKSTYQVPEGYFEDLAETILRGIKAATPEIASSSVLSPPGRDLRSLSAYEAPPGFFDEFAQKLMKRIKASEASGAGEELEILSPFLSRLDKKNPFREPVGYFDQLTNQLPARLRAAGDGDKAEEVLSPLLNELKNKRVYAVPEGYFNDLAEMVLARVGGLTAAETPVSIPVLKTVPIVVPMHRTGGRRWLKYAAAAMVAGLLLTTGVRIFHTNKPVPGASPEDVEGKIAKVSDQEIVNFLESQDESLSEPMANSIASLDLNDNDMNDLLGDIPDAELKQYVDEQGDPKDPITN